MIHSMGYDIKLISAGVSGSVPSESFVFLWPCYRVISRGCKENVFFTGLTLYGHSIGVL